MEKKYMYMVSIILPCYNVEKEVWSCLKSIERQTIGIKNLQLIMINDGSKDNTLSYLQVFKEKYPDNVILINLTSNVGISAARNIGMDLADSKYITFVDSDDMLASDMIEKLYAEACKSNSEIVACGNIAFENEEECNAGENRECLECGSNIKDLTDISVRKSYILKMTGGFFRPVWGKMFRVDFLKKYNLRFLEGHVYEDCHFTLMCILLANSFCELEQKLYYYRKNNEGSIMHRKYNLEMNKDHVYVANYVYDNMKKLGIYEECMDKYGYEIKAVYIWIAFFIATSYARKAYLAEVEFFKQNLFEADPECLSNPYVTSICDPLYLEMIELLK